MAITELCRHTCLELSKTCRTGNPTGHSSRWVSNLCEITNGVLWWLASSQLRR